MVSAFLALIPIVPYAAFRASTPPGAPLAAAAQEEAVDIPVHPLSPPTPGPSVPPSSPLSARAVREASRGWTWKPLESPGWKILMADHFVLRGDVPVAALRTSAAYLEEFRRMIRDGIGGDDSGMMFSARVFAEPRDFRRYAARAGAANAESFYDPRTAELVVWLDATRGTPWLQKTLAHEFTHAYMDRVWKRTEPLWFAEGMAEYFSSFAARGGRLVPGVTDRPALLLLRLDDPLPLRRFLKLGRDEMYGEAFPLLYAQSWSFVHYLFSRKDGLVDLLLRGQPLDKVDELEKGWKEYLKALE